MRLKNRLTRSSQSGPDRRDLGQNLSTGLFFIDHPL
jgi:hypothetical protein